MSDAILVIPLSSLLLSIKLAMTITIYGTLAMLMYLEIKKTYKANALMGILVAIGMVIVFIALMLLWIITVFPDQGEILLNAIPEIVIR